MNKCFRSRTHPLQSPRNATVFAGKSQGIARFIAVSEGEIESARKITPNLPKARKITPPPANITPKSAAPHTFCPRFRTVLAGPKTIKCPPEQVAQRKLITRIVSFLPLSRPCRDWFACPIHNLLSRSMHLRTGVYPVLMRDSLGTAPLLLDVSIPEFIFQDIHTGSGALLRSLVLRRLLGQRTTVSAIPVGFKLFAAAMAKKYRWSICRIRHRPQKILVKRIQPLSSATFGTRSTICF